MQLTLFGGTKLSSKPFMSYRGSKSGVAKTLMRCLPKGITELVSPFVGGGGFELHAAASGIKVKAYDNHIGLVRLWKSMLKDANAVVLKVLEDFPGDLHELHRLVSSGDIYKIEDDLEFACLALKVGRLSFNGDFLSTSWVCQNFPLDKVKRKFGLSVVKKLDVWGNDNMSVEFSNWRDTLSKHTDAFLYCDPPYIGLEYNYGKMRRDTDFDHVGFAESMCARHSGWAISYIDNPLLRELYKGYEIVDMKWNQPSLNVVGRKQKDNNEIVILKPPARNPHLQ